MVYFDLLNKAGAAFIAFVISLFGNKPTFCQTSMPSLYKAMFGITLILS